MSVRGCHLKFVANLEYGPLHSNTELADRLRHAMEGARPTESEGVVARYFDVDSARVVLYPEFVRADLNSDPLVAEVSIGMQTPSAVHTVVN